MTLLWLPKRSPKLNPMDTLWGQGKDVTSANKQYATIDEQVGRFLGHLRCLTNQEALHTSGVLSKRFWLKAALSNYFCGLAYSGLPTCCSYRPACLNQPMMSSRVTCFNPSPMASVSPVTVRVATRRRNSLTFEYISSIGV